MVDAQLVDRRRALTVLARVLISAIDVVPLSARDIAPTVTALVSESIVHRTASYRASGAPSGQLATESTSASVPSASSAARNNAPVVESSADQSAQPALIRQCAPWNARTLDVMERTSSSMRARASVARRCASPAHGATSATPSSP